MQNVHKKIEQHAEALGVKKARVRQHVVRGAWFLEGETDIPTLSTVLTGLNIRGKSCGSLGNLGSYYEITDPAHATFRSRKYSPAEARRDVKALHALVKTLNGFDAKKVARFGSRIRLLAALVNCINKEITCEIHQYAG